jgi:2-desacetyl-2-hydroxyethyl bacteriochlorophyllide A dehydrogenase
MKGHKIIFESPGKAVIEKFEVPRPGPGQVLLESEYSVISAGTERANLIQLPNTDSATRGFPWQPGYCGSGKVIAVGEDVTELKNGDRVIINWGGHRSHIIKPAEAIHKIEDSGIDLLDAAFAPIAAFSFLGVRKLRIELGESAMIAGQGILGVFALQIACLSGAIPVVVSDFDPTRRKLALKLGAATAFSPDEKNFTEKTREACGGGGPNGVVEVTGSAAALKQALEYIAFEGRISLLGCTRVSDVPIDYYKYVHRRGISIIGAHTKTRPGNESAPGRWTERDDYHAFLKFVAAGKLLTHPLISEIASPEKAPEIYSRLAETENPPLGIVFDWKKTK